MIIKSYKKQKRKSILIFIQLFISSLCLALGMGFFEINILHISDVKSIINTDIIYTSINLNTSFQDVSESERNNIKKFYDEIKADERIESIGTYDVGYISDENNRNRPNSMYKDVPVIIMDDAFWNILNDEEKAKIFKGKNNNELNMALGSNISRNIKLGEKVSIYNPSLSESYMSIQNNKIDNDTNFLSISSCGFITDDIISTRNAMFVLLPQYGETLYSDKYFIKLKEDVDSIKFLKDVDNIGNQHGLETHTHAINYEIKTYIEGNKIPMIASLTLSIILLILSSIGLVGVILSSILQRKKEFGIRYALGCTPNGLIKLIVGEIMVLFVISTLLGIVCSFIISLFIDNMKIGLLTMSFTTGIMLVFCLISSILPAKKISNINPITLINKGCD